MSIRLTRTIATVLVVALPMALMGCPGPSQPTEVTGETLQPGFRVVQGTLSVDGAAGVITTGGGNIIAPGGGNIIATGGGNYRTVLQAKGIVSGKVKLSASGFWKEADVGADGKWKLSVKMGFTYQIEGTAVDASGKTYKAVSTIEVPQAQDPQVMDAPSLVTRRTGSIQGLIQLKDAAPGETPEGADVFISGGTSLVGKANDKGRFTLSAIPEGTWNIVIQKPGYKTAHLKGVVVKAGQPQLLGEGVVLEKDGGQPTGARGLITDTSGKAVVGASITAYPKDRATAGLDNFVATTDGNGEFELVNLPPGQYTLQVYRPFYELPPVQELTVEAGKVSELSPVTLSSTVVYFGQASGTVVDEEGNPIDGVIVQTEPQVTDQQFTDAAGSFTLDRILAGTYTLHVTAAGYEPFFTELALPNQQNAKIDIGSVTLKAAK